MDTNVASLDPAFEREGLTLTRYAEIAAHVQHFPRRQSEEVLVRLGFTTAMWTAAVSAWTDALLEESDAEGKVLAGVYGTTFATTRARLRRETPEIVSLGPLMVDEREAPEAVVSVAPDIDSAPPPRAHEVAAPPVLAFSAGENSPWARPVASTFTAGERSLSEPPPFVPSYMLAPAPEIAWMPEAMRRFTTVDTTQAGGSASTAPVLPFAGDAGARASALENALAEAARIQGPPSERAVDEEVGSTMALTGLRARVQAAALPFPSTSSTPPGIEALGPPSRPVTGQRLETTMALSGLRALAQGTVQPILPAGTSPPRATVALSLERYASLWVELSLAPEHRAETLRRYQLTELQWVAVEREWQDRLTREPSACTAWEHACTEYRTWLVTYRR